MASFSHVVVVGRVTRDVEAKESKNGSSYAIVGLAINDRRKQGDEWVEETTFVDVILGGKVAEIAGQYLKKGQTALFSGKLKMDSWEKDGQKQSKIKILADSMQMLTPKGDGDSRVTPEREYSSTKNNKRAFAQEDVPF